MTPLKVLSIAAEAAPFAKTGGLGDVCGSLPIALRKLGHDVRVVLPAYLPIEEAAVTGRWSLKSMPGFLRVPVSGGFLPAGVFEGTLPGSDVPIYFIAEKNLFSRANIYGYNDDAYRFSFFSRAALDLINALQWVPDVIHTHDWHTGPALLWLATSGQYDPTYHGIATLHTIHNIAHQGRVSRNLLGYLGVQAMPLNEEGASEINFMARAIFHANMINAVSPTYAREIMTPEGGFGLDGLLRFRHYDVHGILNGLDYEHWNPAIDRQLVSHFDVNHIENRIQNKLALQQRLGLTMRADVPLVAMVTRLHKQKGLDIVGHALHLLMNNMAGEAQFVVLGTGARIYEEMFTHLASYHSGRMAAVLSYSEDLAPQIYAGSDIFLMPSLFEPCGLGQLIAMRYGSVPVVRAIGGLADTVRDMVTGFTFYDFSSTDLWDAIARALFIYRNDPDSWRSIQRQGMLSDFSWDNSARGYQQLFEWAIARVRG